METREEKFKTYREEIAKNNSEEEIIHQETLTPEDLEFQQENYDKKNTLTMSIDQIIEAHDEYTTSIEQKELEEKLKKERKERNLTKAKVFFKYFCIALVLLLIVAILIIIILQIMQ